MSANLDQLKANIDDALNVYLPTDSNLSNELTSAMRYSALGSGKRLRPMLVCATCTAVGGTLEDALAPACALEFIHAYSLIHDDLPAMDDDDLRHGLPSCHVRFGEATAILAGDALQALAFDVLANATNLSDATRLQSIQILSQAVGPLGMVGGQSYDMASEGQALPLESLQLLHGAKTGALFSAAVRIGATIGNASNEQIVLLKEFSDRVGLAFQVIDDVLDVTASTEELGKPAGSDEAASKSTYVAHLGLKAAQDYAEKLLSEALIFLQRVKPADDALAQIAQRAVRRNF